MFFLEKHRGENAGDGGSFARKLQRFLGAGAWPDAADVFTNNTCLHWAAL
jgi:hypothetical protein